MARNVLIQIRRGLEREIGTLAVGELGYCEDTKKLYIGTATGNVLLVAAETVGDMLKSVYDTNNNGKVDMAEMADSVPWNGVTNKPSTFPPSSHKHTKSQITDFPSSLPADGGTADRANILNIPDTRNVSETPGQLQKRGVTGAFKYRNKVGNPPVSSSSSYVFIITIAGYGGSTDGSGGWPVQLAFGRNNLAVRYGTSSTAWSSWFEIARSIDIPTKLNQLKGPLTWNDLKGV